MDVEKPLRNISVPRGIVRIASNIIVQGAAKIFPLTTYMVVDCKPGSCTRDLCFACRIDSLPNQWKICLVYTSVEPTFSTFSRTLPATIQMQNPCLSSAFWQVLSFTPMKHKSTFRVLTIMSGSSLTEPMWSLG